MGGLRKFWQVWKKFGQFMLDWTSRIVLTVFYFTIFAPFGIGIRLFRDNLDIKGKTAKWIKRENSELTLAEARRLT
jgi:hypothetical protein